MKDARLDIAYRDYCAHLLIPLNKCRQATMYMPWKCGHERHEYEKCEYVEHLYVRGRARCGTRTCARGASAMRHARARRSPRPSFYPRSSVRAGPEAQARGMIAGGAVRKTEAQKLGELTARRAERRARARKEGAGVARRPRK